MLASKNHTREVWKSHPRSKAIQRATAKMHQLQRAKYLNCSTPMLCSVFHSPSASTGSAGALVRAQLLCSVDTVRSINMVIWKILVKTSQPVVSICWQIKGNSYKMCIHQK